MKKEKIDNILNELQKMFNTNETSDFIIAVYLFMRIGNGNYSENDLNEVKKILDCYGSIFNEELNEEIENLFN